MGAAAAIPFLFMHDWDIRRSATAAADAETAGIDSLLNRRFASREFRQ